MIFVAVCPFSDVIPIDIDVQEAARSAWLKRIEAEESAGLEPIVTILRWLPQNARGPYRHWVDVTRREPAINGGQRITGEAGYWFRDPDDAIAFRQAFRSGSAEESL